jgi:hypothetical protein
MSDNVRERQQLREKRSKLKENQAANGHSLSGTVLKIQVCKVKFILCLGYCVSS